MLCRHHLTSALRHSTATMPVIRRLSPTEHGCQRARFTLAAPAPSSAPYLCEEQLDASLQQVLCSSAAPLPMSHVYYRLTNPHRLIREFHHSKRSRRLHSQRVALRFLRRHNVLMHSLLFYSPATNSWNHTAEFSRLALVGEAHMKAEVQARVIKLLPDVPATTFASLSRNCSALQPTCQLFEELQMRELVDSPLQVPGVAAAPASRRAHRGAPVLADVNMYHMFHAVVAEMYWFAARTRGADRTTNNALFPPSDVLILNVLCTHLLETLPAELVMSQLAAPIASINERWTNKFMSLPSQLHLKPRTLNVHSLSSTPHPYDCKDMRTSGAVPIRALSQHPEMRRVASVMHPILERSKIQSPSPPVRCSHSQLALSPMKQATHPDRQVIDVPDTRRREIYSQIP